MCLSLLVRWVKVGSEHTVQMVMHLDSEFSGPLFILFHQITAMEKRKHQICQKIRGGVTCNDTAEQSFNFSKRLGPLNLQVPISFCRQCVNIVAVLVQKL